MRACLAGDNQAGVARFLFPQRLGCFPPGRPTAEQPLRCDARANTNPPWFSGCGGFLSFGGLLVEPSARIWTDWQSVPILGLVSHDSETWDAHAAFEVGTFIRVWLRLHPAPEGTACFDDLERWAMNLQQHGQARLSELGQPPLRKVP